VVAIRTSNSTIVLTTPAKVKLAEDVIEVAN